MRAITVDAFSSEPCCLHRAALTIHRFTKTSVSHLPSSDCHTYIHTVLDAMKQLAHELGATYPQRAADVDAHDYGEDPVEGNRRHQDQESKGDMVIAADGSQGDSAAGAELDVPSVKKKGNKKKKNEDLPPEDIEVGRADSHIPPSPEIATENKRRKKKHPNQEIVVYVKQEPVEEEVVSEKKKSKKKKEKDHPNQEIGFYVKQEPVEEEVVSEKKKSKKKKDKDHVKLEEGVNEVQEKIVNDSTAEQRVARTEREQKKKKHEQEVGGAEVVKEEITIADGDLEVDKKRKKKRGRGDIYDNALEQVEHTKKKQKKHSGD